MIIKSDGIFLRLSDKNDRGLAELIDNSDDLVNMSETTTYPENMPTEIIFRIEKDGAVIGKITFSRIRWYNRKSEISIIIKHNFRGKGFGTEALMSAMHYAFDRMNLHRLEAEVYDFNEASIKLVEKLGFKKEGLLREAKYMDGKYYGIIRYGILKDEFNR